MRLVGHILDYMLDHMLDYMLNYMIISLITMALHILNIKYIKYKFKLENDVARPAKQKFLIHLQNILQCVEFILRNLGFWYN